MKYPYFFGTLLAFTASAFLSYALARHHSHAQRLQKAEPQAESTKSPVVNREHKGNRLDVNTFDGRLAVTPEMFTDRDCNPEYYCPWGSPHRLPWWMQ